MICELCRLTAYRRLAVTQTFKNREKHEKHRWKAVVGNRGEKGGKHPGNGDAMERPLRLSLRCSVWYLSGVFEMIRKGPIRNSGHPSHRWTRWPRGSRYKSIRKSRQKARAGPHSGRNTNTFSEKHNVIRNKRKKTLNSWQEQKTNNGVQAKGKRVKRKWNVIKPLLFGKNKQKAKW